VDGTQYDGACACLIGSLAQVKETSPDQVCEFIPYYDKGLHNPSEQWFGQIRKGDTPEGNKYAAYALKLIDIVLAESSGELLKPVSLEGEDPKNARKIQPRSD
jgi:hypothetical protein